MLHGNVLEVGIKFDASSAALFKVYTFFSLPTLFTRHGTIRKVCAQAWD